jgi:peptidoglycan LD-endopeptidase LytH
VSRRRGRWRALAVGFLVVGALAVAAREPLLRLVAPQLPGAEVLPREEVAATPIAPSVATPLAVGAERPDADPPGPPAAGDDLAALGRTLVVPVAGILRTELRDSYTEARGDRVHHAMDVLAPRGTPVLSAADGHVLKLFDSAPGGLMVYTSDPTRRFILLYGHLDRYAEGLAEGAALTRGQVIGYVGTTGNAAVGTPHLHFEILRGDPDVAWWLGDPVNPFPLLAP